MVSGLFSLMLVTWRKVPLKFRSPDPDNHHPNLNP